MDPVWSSSSVFSISLTTLSSLSFTVHLQMWLRSRRVPARSCWTWRRRRSKGRRSWRAWRNSWGSAPPGARSLTQNYSIFLYVCVVAWKTLHKRVQIFSLSFIDFALFTLFFVSVLNPPPDFCRESWRVWETLITSFRLFRTRWMKTPPRSSLQQCESQILSDERVFCPTNCCCLHIHFIECFSYYPLILGKIHILVWSCAM